MPIGMSARLVSPFQPEYPTNSGMQPSSINSPIMATSISSSAEWPQLDSGVSSPAHIGLFSSVSQHPGSPVPKRDAYPPPPFLNWSHGSFADLSPRYSYFDERTPAARSNSLNSFQPSHAPASAMPASFSSHIPPPLAPEVQTPYSGYHTLNEPTWSRDDNENAEKFDPSQEGHRVDWRGFGRKVKETCHGLTAGVAEEIRDWNNRRTRTQDAAQSLVTEALKGVAVRKFGPNPRKWAGRSTKA